MITTRSLAIRYSSYFTLKAMRDTEVQDKILEFIDRDMAWVAEQAKQPEQKPRKVKALCSWSGTAKQLKKILSLRK